MQSSSESQQLAFSSIQSSQVKFECILIVETLHYVHSSIICALGCSFTGGSIIPLTVAPGLGWRFRFLRIYQYIACSSES
jgi:hypothetical protein